MTRPNTNLYGDAFALDLLGVSIDSALQILGLAQDELGLHDGGVTDNVQTTSRSKKTRPITRGRVLPVGEETATDSGSQSGRAASIDTVRPRQAERVLIRRVGSRRLQAPN